MNATLGNIQNCLDSIVKYLQPHMNFVNCHMVGYLTENLWKTHVPENVQSEISSDADIDRALDVFWDFHKDESQLDSTTQHKFRGLIKFLENSKMHCLEDYRGLWFSPAQLNEKLETLGLHAPNQGLNITEFMTKKKNHEVETAAHLVATMCSYGNGDHSNSAEKLVVIDAGDGKGYLSSRLALEYQLKILGIDARTINTEGALKRSAMLEKAWNGLARRAQDIQNGLTPPRKGKRITNRSPPCSKNETDKIKISSVNYKTTTHFITSNTDFMELFRMHFPDHRPTGFCLSGLHTCGNLATTCLQSFTENSSIIGLCNIGCCYHFLTEEFQRDEFFASRYIIEETDDSTYGFPMSNFLRDRQFKLGRNARMLALQSLDRTLNGRDLPNKTVFYRALLEILISEKNTDLRNCIQVGRIKKCNSFVDYVQKCSARLSFNVDHANDEQYLNDLLKTYEHENNLMKLFYLIRMTFAPILEAVILLDRLLFLKERLMNNAYLVKLFDPVVSPRCYGVVALKNK